MNSQRLGKQLSKARVVGLRASGGLPSHRRHWPSARSPACRSVAGSTKRRYGLRDVVKSVCLRGPEAVHNDEHLQVSSSGSLSANRSFSSSGSIKLPKLTPVWELLATLDALAVPWGLKQLSMAFMASHMLGVSPPAEYYVLNWAISVLCYLIDHYKDQGSVGDVINVPIRLAMVKRHRAALKAHLAISLVLVVGSLALLPGTVLQAFIPGAIAVSAYWLPILPNGRTAKQLPAAKNFFCSGVETFALVAFALAAVPAASVSSVVVAASAVFFAAVNVGLAVLADVRDIQGDIVAGTNSIPVIYGVPAALNVAVGCCVAACLAATVAMPHMWPATASVAMILGAGWGFFRDTHTDSSADTSRGPSYSTVSDTFVSWFQASVGLVGCIALHIR